MKFFHTNCCDATIYSNLLGRAIALFGLIVCSLSNNLLAQSNQKQFSFQTLNVDHGLSQNSVVSISQDSTGFLWLATQDGLNKYDGREFLIIDKHFEDVTRPSYNRLGKTYIDKKNNLWVITLSGNLEKFNSSKNKSKTITSIKDVSNIYQSSRLDYYISTFSNGFYKISENHRDTVKVFNSDRALYESIETNDKIYVVGSDLYEIDQSTSVVNAKNLNKNFSCLASSKNGLLFLGTFGQGLYNYDVEEEKLSKITLLGNNTIPQDLNIQDILLDNLGRLWLATYGKGVFVLDFERQQINHFMPHKYNNRSLSYKDVLCLFEDYTGTIWLGTDGGGVSYFDEHLFKFNVLTNNQVPSDIKINVVRCISVDDNNNIWLGTSGEGLTFVNEDRNELKTYTTENSELKTNRIMSLLYKSGKLWIGHQDGGLQILDNGKFKSYGPSSTPKLNANTIWSIYSDIDNNVWLGTRNNGVINFSEETGTIINYRKTKDSNTLVSDNIRAITGNQNGLLYFGADDGGISILDTRKGTIQQVDKIKDKIKCLYIHNNEELFAGTNGKGLLKYDLSTKELISYTTEDGLPNEVIYGILPDNKENLWLSSNRGLTKFNVNSKSFINYYNYDGLQAAEFNTGAYYKASDGTLYFGGLNGINWFKPENITHNQNIPKTAITHFSVFNENKPLDQNYNLKHRQNTVTFRFSGLHLSQPDRNQYMYKLENHDTDWQLAGNQNFAHYTNLPSGDYIFKVKSSNYDGVWNEQPTNFSFSISKPWYATTTAILVYVLLGLVFCYYLYSYFKWKLRMKMRLSLEHNESKRLKNLNEFKTRLYTNISHEFRTPLTLISGPIEEQLKKADLSKEDKSHLQLVKRNSDRLLKLVDQLLDLSKLESGNLYLSVRKDNLSVLLKQICSSFNFETDRKNIEYTFEIEDVEEAWFDNDVVEKIVTNLISNAVKYTPENGYIKFNATVKDDNIIIAILNNGNELDGEEMSKLFKRYFQRKRNSDGVGVGLSLVKELTALAHGNIVVSALNDDDIQFTVTLPIDRSYFNSSEIVESTSDYSPQKIIGESDKSENNGSERLLLEIVEDNHELRNYVVSLFSSEYDIIEANNGRTGINVAIENIPDIIISDVMMPEASGIELCNALKNDRRTNHIPIILLTAKGGEQSELEGLDTGADAYITKPFSNKKLRLRVKKLIELRQSLQQHYLGELPESTSLSKPADQEFLAQLIEKLEEQIRNPEFNAEDLSRRMLMSRMQLHRKLKAITGMTTTEYIRKERIIRAARLLRLKELTVSEIAYEVGFNTPSYFIRTFKKIHNLTPIEYVKKYAS